MFQSPSDQTLLGNKFNYQWEDFSQNPVFDDGHGLPSQGHLGNCYWISPLVSIYVLHPNQIKSLFLDIQQNSSVVKLCVDGEWMIIQVDHIFPIIKPQQPAFTKLIDGAIWAMILEKAWAQVYGSYSLICGGFNRSTLKNITAAPTNKFRTLDPQFNEIFLDLIKQKFPICANSRKQQKDQTLAKNHAYSIIEYNNNIITVRNPWGRKDSIKNMTIYQFIERFASIECCYYYQNYGYQYLEIQNTHLVRLQINVQLPGQYFFTINQRNKRWFREQKQQYQVSPSKITLYNQESILSSQTHNSNKELWINWNVQQIGLLYIDCEIFWIQDFYNKFIFSAYGPKCQIEICDQVIQINNKPTDQYPTFIQRDPELEQQQEESNLQLKTDIQQDIPEEEVEFNLIKQKTNQSDRACKCQIQ
ncbi:hypothetical protein pb186bvf_001768 [Paramecium bursaria]